MPNRNKTDNISYYMYPDTDDSNILPLWHFIAALYTVTTTLIILLNTFCLIVLYCTKILNGPTKVFMISLSAADLTGGIIVGAPMTVVWVIGKWPFGKILCKIYAILGMDSFTVSILTLLFLTTDRYIAIYFPLRYPDFVTLKRA